MSPRRSQVKKSHSKQMIYIVEGIDKSGKSTVILDLVSALPGVPVVFKLKNKPTSGSTDERRKVALAYDELFEQAKKNHINTPIIFDRAYPSELVYSQINRGYDAFYEVDWWRLDEELKEIARFIYCSAPNDVLLERFKQHNETDLTENQFGQVLARYDMFLEKTNLKVLRLDTTMSREENLERIKEFVNQ